MARSGSSATVTVGNLPPICGDRVAGAVFANLIGNALAYTDAARPAAIETAQAGGHRPPGVGLCDDNGLGVAAAHQQRFSDLPPHPGVGQGEDRIDRGPRRRAAPRRVWVDRRSARKYVFVALPEGQGAAC